MTPEEKANELIDKFYEGVRKDGFVMYRETRAKTLALICVEEILGFNHDTFLLNIQAINYWQKVKQIINEK